MRNKKILVVIAFFLSFLNLNAQEKKIKFYKGTLKICSSKSFVIEGYDGDEVIIESLHSKRQADYFSYFPTNQKKGTSTSNNSAKSSYKNKNNKKGKWTVTSTAVSGVYTEDENDTLVKPKTVFFSNSQINNTNKLNAIGKKTNNKKGNWSVTPGVSSISYYNTEIDSLSSKEAIFFNSFKSDKKVGLKKLGKKNENKELGIYFIIEQNDEELIFKDNAESAFIMSANKEQYKIRVPNSIKLNWSTDCKTKSKDGNYFFFISEKSSLSNFDGEVAISSSVQDVKLKDVTGPVSINTIGGNVTVVFDEKLPKKLYSIYSNNGFIDITLSKKSNINIDATAIGIYSDVEFKIIEDKEEGDLQKMKLKLNKGNVKLKLNANLGTIYLRKK